MDKLTRLLPKLLLPAVIMTTLILVTEVIKYPGIFRRYFYVDAKIVVATTLTILIFAKKEQKPIRQIFKINRLLLPILFTTYTALSAIEGAHYVNYVLTTFRIHLDGLALLVIFSFSLLIIDRFLNFKFKKTVSLNIAYQAFVFLIIVYLVKNLTYVVDQSFRRNFYILSHPTNTYDQKMSFHWNTFYNFITFVKNNTPEDATILLPPMKDPWLQGSGNPHFVRAFIFPREIIQIENGDIENLENYPENTYILIAWGTQECQAEGCHGWPRQEISAKKIIYKDPGSTNVIETRTDTVYKMEDDKYVYGLIEL